jgi:protoporphyrinogen oxidase
MRIGIIGAGISGLSAAWYLSRMGHHVEVFERAPEVGGLIATFDFDGLRIDYFYHFLCLQDEGYFALCDELGIGAHIRFVKARTGFYHAGTEYPFTSPADLLRFDPIPFSQRLRFGFFALEARYRREWRHLDELVAKPWLIDRIGRRGYEVVWHPLLALKFGDRHEEISAAWVWHRLHRVARSKGRHGYLEGGTARLLDTLLGALRARGVGVHVDCATERIVSDGDRVTGLSLANGASYECDRLVSTLPLSVLANLLPPGWETYAKSLRRIDYIGIVCVVLKLRKPASRYFWYNVHDDRVPFNGLIEYTNLNPLGGTNGHIVYVPYYVGTDQPLYARDGDAVFAETWRAVKLVSGRVSDDDLLAYRVFRAPFAQAVCPMGFLRLLPDAQAPLRGLHLLDSSYLYPQDRSQSGLILKARQCAEAIGP